MRSRPSSGLTWAGDRASVRHKQARIGAILQLMLESTGDSFSWDYVSEVTMPVWLGACWQWGNAMKTIVRVSVGIAALAGALTLSGCMTLRDGDAYRYENGDRVSIDGSVRYVGWCDARPHNVHCLNQSPRPAA